MWNLNNFSITKKLAILTGALLIALLITGSFSYKAILTLSTQEEDIGLVQMAAVRNLTLADMMHDGLRAVALSAIIAAQQNDEQMKRAAATELKEFSANFKNYLNNVAALPLEQETKTALAQMRPDLDEYLAKANLITELALSGKLNEASNNLPAFQDSYEKLEQSQGKLGDLISKNAEQSTAQSLQTASAAKRNVLLLFIASLAIGLVLSVTIAKNISRPLQQVSDKVAKLALGKLDLQFEYNAKDEIGALNNSCRDLITYLKETSAVAQGVSAGDLTIKINPRSTDDTLSISLGQAVETIRNLIGSISDLTAAKNLNARANASKFSGSYSELLEGVNELLAVTSARVQNVAERVEQLRSLCITNLGKATDAMQNGDLTFAILTGTPFFDVTSDDQIGKLETSINGIITQTQGTVAAFETSRQTVLSVIDETRTIAEAVRDGQLDVRCDAHAFAGSYRELATTINALVQGVATPLAEVSAALDQLAEQNLTVQVAGSYKGQYEQLKTYLNRTCSTLNQALSQVALAAEQVNSAANEISSGSQSLAQGASEQASSLEEVSSSLQEMGAMIKQNAANAKEARSLSEAARTSTDKGVGSMHNLTAAIDKIKASSDATAKIVKTIDEIAFQTNLLALNAAVEAARAGDAGKGFAVVAEEVRSLAMRSAEAARQTADLIEESVKNSDSGVTLNREVLANLEEINQQVEKVSVVMAEIAASSQQQTQNVEQINTAVEQMNLVTQQAAANSEESAAAAEELSGQSQEMLTMVGSFKLSSDSRARAAAPRAMTAHAAAAPKAAAAPPRTSPKSAAEAVIPFDLDFPSDSLQDF